MRFEDPATGGPARPGDLRHRRALVLAFVHDDCDECARWAADVSARLATRPDADVRIVAPDRGPGGERALPLWTDPHGSRARLLTDPGAPAVLLLDRFSALREAWVAEDHALPGSDRIAAELAYLAVECPECSV